MIRRVELSELEEIYTQRIEVDFPPAERRPLYQIKRLFEKGRYVCLVLEEAGQIAAYATFICDEAVPCVFLDYYAVDAGQRGQGTGSRFLAMLVSFWAQKSGIILECEAPETAKDDAERETRVRRIRFYERGGAIVTPYRWYAFSVDYRILYLPAKAPLEKVDVARDLQALYGLSMPRLMRAVFTRIRKG